MQRPIQSCDTAEGQRLTEFNRKLKLCLWCEGVRRIAQNYNYSLLGNQLCIALKWTRNRQQLRDQQGRWVTARKNGIKGDRAKDKDRDRNTEPKEGKLISQKDFLAWALTPMLMTMRRNAGVLWIIQINRTYRGLLRREKQRQAKHMKWVVSVWASRRQ